MFALMLGVACTASAQKTGKKKAQKSVKTEQVSNVSSDQEEKLTLTKEVYPQKEENNNLYHGLTKKLTFDRMIPPHGLEVTYDKTVHILFPASVKYVDLGSEDLIAGKADGAENVIRVKAAVKNFKKETNMSVITEDGSFYTFNVRYAKEPLILNIEMADFIHDGEADRDRNVSGYLEIYGDDVLLYTSPTMVSDSAPEPFSVDVSGVTFLKIVFSTANGFPILCDGLLEK